MCYEYSSQYYVYVARSPDQFGNACTGDETLDPIRNRRIKDEMVETIDDFFQYTIAELTAFKPEQGQEGFVRASTIETRPKETKRSNYLVSSENSFMLSERAKERLVRGERAIGTANSEERQLQVRTLYEFGLPYIFRHVDDRVKDWMASASALPQNSFFSVQSLSTATVKSPNFQPVRNALRLFAPEGAQDDAWTSTTPQYLKSKKVALRKFVICHRLPYAVRRLTRATALHELSLSNNVARVPTAIILKADTPVVIQMLIGLGMNAASEAMVKMTQTDRFLDPNKIRVAMQASSSKSTEPVPSKKLLGPIYSRVLPH
ncbi:hypothetical protein DFS34DRAFT_691026 [Phlyctochytrium arcticum]|nr:hypothetical protein DFS34DRAFT_691026 [Phlyctochytrium arcticum]